MLRKPNANILRIKKRVANKSRGLNSPWGLVGGVVKYFRFSIHEILWEISFANVMLYSASIPKFNREGGDEDDDGKFPYNERPDGEISFGELFNMQ